MKVILPLQKQPKILAAFKDGFDTVSKHFYLVLFPVILDLFLLFGVRITISDLMHVFIQQLTLPPSATPELIAGWQTLKSQLVDYFQVFSLTSFLRSFPVGIPSLFSKVAFQRNPLGDFHFIQIQQPGAILLGMLGFSILGLLAAYLFYHLIARASAKQELAASPTPVLHSLAAWFLIPVMTTLIASLVFFPVLFMISLIGAFFPIFTSFGYFLLTIAAISLITPVFFTPHLIHLEKIDFFRALITSFRTFRLTNPKSTTFLFLAIAVSYFTDMLWRIPEEDSWMLLISVLGHALISTIILAASFHYCLSARESVREFNENQMSESILA